MKILQIFVKEKIYSLVISEIPIDFLFTKGFCNLLLQISILLLL